MALSKGLVVAAIAGLAAADVYLHFPGGSNNRCDEKNNNRQNANRLFDSENNAAGGYNIADSTYAFYEGTKIQVAWMTQHSCGNGAATKELENPESTICHNVLQFTCNSQVQMFVGPYDLPNTVLKDGVSLGRPAADRPEQCDGNCENSFNTVGDTCVQTMPEDCIDVTTVNNQQCNALTLPGDRGTFNSNTCRCSDRKILTYGLHEPVTYYKKCRSRERNKGLFTANQRVSDDQGAAATRQDANSQRYGFECPEERDYYPYWHPTPWMDIAVFTSNISYCNMHVRQESQNVKAKGECVCKGQCTAERMLEAAASNNALDCTSASPDGLFEWRDFPSWNSKYSRLGAPECLLAPFQTDNRLGNIAAIGDLDDVEGEMAHYDWVLPSWVIPEGEESETCVLRLRYNISTSETPWHLTALDNNVIENDPVIKIGAQSNNLRSDLTMPLRLSINTAQFGRTFEDRSYTFQIKRRPSELRGRTIHNMNVRGKRGNIAQVRNNLEYDFHPTSLRVAEGDFVHFQFVGSDYNNNNNAGQGRQGTDRTNVVHARGNDPAGNMIERLSETATIFSEEDLNILAWLGQKPEDCYSTEEMVTNRANSGNDVRSCHFLNGVRQYNNPQARFPLNQNPKLPNGYFSHVARVQSKGVFVFLSSRNNSFTNRSQKGVIYSGSNSNVGKAVAIGVGVVGGIAAVALIAVGAFFVVKKVRYSTRV